MLYESLRNADNLLELNEFATRTIKTLKEEQEKLTLNFSVRKA